MSDGQHGRCEEEPEGSETLVRALAEACELLDMQNRGMQELLREIAKEPQGVRFLREQATLRQLEASRSFRAGLTSLFERLARKFADPTLSDKLIRVAHRRLFSDAEEAPARIGPYVVWRNAKGGRKHDIVQPGPFDPACSWDVVVRSLPFGSPSDQRILLCGCPELAPLFSSCAPTMVGSLDELESGDSDEFGVVIVGANLLLASEVSHTVKGKLDSFARAGAAVAVWARDERERSNFDASLLPPHVKVIVPSNAEEGDPRQVSLGYCPQVERAREATVAGQLAWREHREQGSIEAAQRRLSALLGIPPLAERLPLVSVLCVSHRPALFRECIETFRRQTYERKELILVANADHLDRDLLDATLSDARITLLRTNQDMSLGQSLNRARVVAQGELWAKMDDDDYYGPNYLRDAVLSMREQQAGVVGKGAYYRFLEGTGRLYLTRETAENAISDRFVHGGTIVADRAKVAPIEFLPVVRGTDTLFLQQCKLLGIKIYSADRFNFAYVRYGQPGHHTFDVGNGAYLDLSELVAESFDKSVIDV